MTPHYFVQGLFAFAGIIAALAALLNWNWFFSSQNSQFLVSRLGRQKARLAYGLLGLLMIGTAVFLYLHT